MNCEQVLPLLDAYLDNELDDATAKSIAWHLPQCSDCAAAIDQRLLLASQLRILPQMPTPPQLRRNIELRLDRDDQGQIEPPMALMSRRRAFRISALASVIGLALGTGLGLGLSSGLVRWPPAADQSDDLVARHAARLARPDTLVQLRSDDRHSVKPWFAGKVDFAPPVRELSEKGFVQVGGDLDTIEGQNTAVIVYRIRNHVISLFA